ncbi:hypothetical protein T484DRAFT_3634564, partial [Baffinella frigidus]
PGHSTERARRPRRRWRSVLLLQIRLAPTAHRVPRLRRVEAALLAVLPVEEGRLGLCALAFFRRPLVRGSPHRGRRDAEVQLPQESRVALQRGHPALAVFRAVRDGLLVLGAPRRDRRDAEAQLPQESRVALQREHRRVEGLHARHGGVVKIRGLAVCAGDSDGNKLPQLEERFLAGRLHHAGGKILAGFVVDRSPGQAQLWIQTFREPLRVGRLPLPSHGARNILGIVARGLFEAQLVLHMCQEPRLLGRLHPLSNGAHH